MITKIQGEAPFQVLTNNFSISPSQEGYTLQISADGENYSNLFSVGANVTRLVTGVAANSYYRLLGNQSDVSINWMKTCVTEGGGGGGDMSNYYTKQETNAEISAATSPIEEHIDDVERVTASALTELHNDVLELSASTPDMSSYYTKQETDAIIADIDLNKLSPVDSFPASAETGTVVAKNNVSGFYWENPDATGATFTFHYGDISSYVFQENELFIGKLINTDLPNDNIDKECSLYISVADGTIPIVTYDYGDIHDIAGDGSVLPINGYEEAEVFTDGTMTFALSSEVGSGVLQISLAFDSPAGKVPYFTLADGYEDVQKSADGVYQYDGTNWNAIPDLTNYYTKQETDTEIADAISDIPQPDLSNYYTKSEVDTTISGINDNIAVKEEVVSRALNELHNDVLDLSGATGNFYTKAETDAAISTATADKVSSTSVSTIWRGTQAEYDAITTPDASTLYIIVNN